MNKNILVHTKYGEVNGIQDKNICVWKGIPYALPPVGERRFKQPLPPDKWDGVLECFEFSDSPVQVHMLLSGISKKHPISEDCLYLNIWSPAADSKKRPVFFWIYGGAFTCGSGLIDMYNGHNLAQNEDIVVVTFNYRVGALGFLDFSMFDESFECNTGLMDQYLALKWVYENIETFGGDPENIVILGQSAGANSVTTFITMPQVRKYFSKAIALSSYPANTNTKEDAAEYAKKFLKLMNIPVSEINKLHEAPPEELARASMELERNTSSESQNKFAFLPVIDGTFLKNFPLTAVEKPIDDKHIPLIMGTCENEGSLYTKLPVPLITVTKNLAERFLIYSEGNVDEYLINIYQKYSEKFIYAYLGGDITFRIPTVWYADRYSKHNDTYLYNFKYVSKLFRLLNIHTIHGTDIPFLFSNFRATISRIALIFELNKKPAFGISSRMGKDFSQFARTGAAPWEKYSSEKRPVKVYNTIDSMDHDPLKAELEAWEKTRLYERIFRNKNTGGSNDR